MILAYALYTEHHVYIFSIFFDQYDSLSLNLVNIPILSFSPWFWRFMFQAPWQQFDLPTNGNALVATPSKADQVSTIHPLCTASRVPSLPVVYSIPLWWSQVKSRSRKLVLMVPRLKMRYFYSIPLRLDNRLRSRWKSHRHQLLHRVPFVCRSYWWCWYTLHRGQLLRRAAFVCRSRRGPGALGFFMFGPSPFSFFFWQEPDFNHFWLFTIGARSIHRLC